MSTKAIVLLNGVNYVKNYDGYMGGVALSLIENIANNNGIIDLSKSPNYITHEQSNINQDSNFEYRIGLYGENFRYVIDGDTIQVYEVCGSFDNKTTKLIGEYDILDFMNNEAKKFIDHVTKIGGNFFTENETMNDYKVVKLSSTTYDTLSNLLK